MLDNLPLIFTPFNLPDALIWLFVSSIFAYSIFKTTFKKRFILDYWSYTLLLVFFIPFVFMYWFAGSSLNIISVGGAILGIQENLQLAFYMTFLGIFSFFVGAALSHTAYARPITAPITFVTQRTFSIFANPSKGRRYAFVMLCLSFLISAFIVSKIGFGFGARDSSLEDNSFRPLLNMNLSFLLPVSTLILSSRALAHKKRADIALCFLAAPLILITGTKAALLSPLMTLIILYTASSQCSLKKLILLFSGFASVFFLIPVLNRLRHGGTDNTSALIEFLYGNAFSDLRDFAWFLSCWDGVLYKGSTYLAGILSFLPRSISPFREQFAYGVVTAKTVGFSPLEHAGIRIGVFGEPYINFGWIGVIVIGLIMGICIRHLYRWIYSAARIEDRIIRMSVSMFVGEQILKLGNSSAFFSLYGFAALLIGNEILSLASRASSLKSEN